jgi:hypothetical protein
VKKTSSTTKPAVAPKAEAIAETAKPLDPLRDSLYRAKPAEEAAIRSILLGDIMESLTGMSASEVQSVARFIDIVNRDRGYITPAEDFITGLVDYHYSGFGGLTPAEALERIEEPTEGFRENFKEAVERASEFRAMYPKLEAAA